MIELVKETLDLLRRIILFLCVLIIIGREGSCVVLVFACLLDVWKVEDYIFVCTYSVLDNSLN